MKKIIPLNKKEGETPLMALENFRLKNKEYKDAKMTYAGRLDPMASGVLLVLAGEETKNKEKYLKLDKEYEFEVLLGFATDTYDILGKVISSPHRQDFDGKELEKEIKKNLKPFKGKSVQEYPAYSSKQVNGKPLFAYARAGEEVEMPSREIHIKNIQLLGIKTITAKKLLFNIKKRIGKVQGDFRQKEILEIWHENLHKKPTDKFYLGSFHIKCSTGTYVRSVANSLGQKMGVPTLAYSIKRTKLGKWSKVR